MGDKDIKLDLGVESISLIQLITNHERRRRDAAGKTGSEAQ